MNFITNILFFLLLIFSIFISSFGFDEGSRNFETWQNLNCDFDENFCGWKNVALPPENKMRWKLIEKKFVLQNQEFYNYLNSGFIFTEFDKKPSITTLMSSIIALDDPTTIYFRAYILGSSRLSICQKIISIKNTKFQNCQFYSSQNFGFTDYFYKLSAFTKEKSQIVIRAFCPNYGDYIGLDSFHVMNEIVIRQKRNNEQKNIQVISFDEWMRVKNDTDQISTVNLRPKVLLVVSKSVENTTETFENRKNVTSEKNEEKCTRSFCFEDSMKENEQKTTESLQSKDDAVTKMPINTESPKTEDSKQAVANLAQWISILRNLAPILPVIPSLINSLKNGESPPTSSATANFHGNNNAYVDPTMPVSEPIFSFKNMAVQRRFSPVSAITPVNQRNPNENSQSFTSSAFPTENYKAPMNKDAEILQDLNLSTLTVNELKTLESIHKKIFPINSENKKTTTTESGESRRKPLKTQGNFIKSRINTVIPVSATTNAPIVIFDKPKQVTKSPPSQVDANDSKQFRYLTPEMVRELNMVANMPDLEPLTDGLDLSLLNKPGGFSILKQQFLERLFQKIPLKSEDSDLLLSS